MKTILSVAFVALLAVSGSSFAGTGKHHVATNKATCCPHDCPFCPYGSCCSK